jgi:hypothetical protein
MKKLVMNAVFVATALSAYASDKIQIDVVEATTTTQSMTSHPNFLFEARAILPDGAHAELTCQAMDKNCGGIEPISPEKTGPDQSRCDTSPDGATMTCTHTNLGKYWATRSGNFLLIDTSRGKRKYHIVGSW